SLKIWLIFFFVINYFYRHESKFYFKHSSSSSIIDLLPINNGDRWCSSVGITSNILCFPLVALPPAISRINAKGLHSYNKRNFPFGLSVVPGYIKMPPLIKFLCTSETILPI